MHQSVRLTCRAAGALVAIGLIVASLGCKKSPAAPDLNVVATDLVVGTGALAQAGNIIQFNYTAWLRDTNQPDGKGAVFTSNAGKSPTASQLGVGSLIQGLDIGIPGMQVGGSRRLVIPPALAYGSTGATDQTTGAQVVPPNAYVVYEITLVAVL